MRTVGMNAKKEKMDELETLKKENVKLKKENAKLRKHIEGFKEQGTDSAAPLNEQEE